MQLRTKDPIVHNRIYSLKDLCELFGVSRWSFQPIIKNKELLPIKVGRVYSFTGQSILDFIAKKQRGER